MGCELFEERTGVCCIWAAPWPELTVGCDYRGDRRRKAKELRLCRLEEGTTDAFTLHVSQMKGEGSGISQPHRVHRDGMACNTRRDSKGHLLFSKPLGSALSSARGARGSENHYHGKGMNAANVMGDEIRSKTETLPFQRERKLLIQMNSCLGRKHYFPNPDKALFITFQRHLNYSV